MKQNCWGNDTYCWGSEAICVGETPQIQSEGYPDQTRPDQTRPDWYGENGQKC